MANENIKFKVKNMLRLNPPKTRKSIQKDVVIAKIKLIAFIESPKPKYTVAKLSELLSNPLK